MSAEILLLMQASRAFHGYEVYFTFQASCVRFVPKMSIPHMHDLIAASYEPALSFEILVLVYGPGM